MFSTKHREPIISNSIRSPLHAFLVNSASQSGCYVLALYANKDHVHILLTLPRTETISKITYKIKTDSSKFLKAKGLPGFSWQRGYAVFSVSQSSIEKVIKYILNQEEHHMKNSFKEEYLLLLKAYDVDYNEQYLWD